MNKLSWSRCKFLPASKAATAFRSCLSPASLLLLAAGLLVSSASGQSLWKEESTSMVADKKADGIGDIITILVQENSTATKDANTKTSKKTGLDASIQSFLFSPSGSGLMTHNGQLPALKYNASHDFDGGGRINNSERVTARIAVRVVDVLPNGNLVIEGTREVAFSGETQNAVLRGTVRPEDISSNNTVFSYNIADATVKFVSKGTITNAQKKGWFTRLWEKITPF